MKQDAAARSVFLVVWQTRAQETVEPCSSHGTHQADYDNRDAVSDEREDRTGACPQ